MKKTNKVLEIKNVKKNYGSFNALKCVDFIINSGELTVLLGPNGAGKSTLFSIIAGLIMPDEGKCIINGKDISNKTVLALKSLGIVFQQPTIDLELSIIDNLLFHARLHGLNIKNIRTIIEKDLRDGNLINKITNKVKHLSGGERRKIELIRALLHKPKILLMDEPTVGLDPGSRKDLLNKILNLKKKEKIGILWTTHLVDEAEKADKVIILNNGVVTEIETPKNIIKKAKTKNLNKAFLKLVEGAKNNVLE